MAAGMDRLKSWGKDLMRRSGSIFLMEEDLLIRPSEKIYRRDHIRCQSEMVLDVSGIRRVLCMEWNMIFVDWKSMNLIVFVVRVGRLSSNSEEGQGLMFLF